MLSGVSKGFPWLCTRRCMSVRVTLPIHFYRNGNKNVEGFTKMSRGSDDTRTDYFFGFEKGKERQFKQSRKQETEKKEGRRRKRTSPSSSGTLIPTSVALRAASATRKSNSSTSGAEASPPPSSVRNSTKILRAFGLGIYCGVLRS